jgi:Flp pilus assembly pilin Flp
MEGWSVNSLRKVGAAFLADEEGALLAEYGLLIAVLVLGLVVVIAIFRGQMASWFNNIGNKLSACDSTSTSC